MYFERIVGIIISRLLSWHCCCNYGIWLVWSVRHEATRLLGSSMVFQEATSEPAERTKNSAAWLLMPHELTHMYNRIAIVNAVITKMFYLASIGGRSRFNLFVKTLNHSVSVLFVARTYYHHRHRGISGTNISIRVKQTSRQDRRTKDKWTDGWRNGAGKEKIHYS